MPEIDPRRRIKAIDELKGGKSQAAVARACGVDRKSVQRWIASDDGAPMTQWRRYRDWLADHAGEIQVKTAAVRAEAAGDEDELRLRLAEIRDAYDAEALDYAVAGDLPPALGLPSSPGGAGGGDKLSTDDPIGLLLYGLEMALPLSRALALAKIPRVEWDRKAALAAEDEQGQPEDKVAQILAMRRLLADVEHHQALWYLRTSEAIARGDRQAGLMMTLMMRLDQQTYGIRKIEDAPPARSPLTGRDRDELCEMAQVQPLAPDLAEEEAEAGE